jgi:hypothetical protein
MGLKNYINYGTTHIRERKCEVLHYDQMAPVTAHALPILRYRNSEVPTPRTEIEKDAEREIQTLLIRGSVANNYDSDGSCSLRATTQSKISNLKNLENRE